MCIMFDWFNNRQSKIQNTLFLQQKNPKTPRVQDLYISHVFYCFMSNVVMLASVV